MTVQIDVKIQNLVTLGATVLNNNSASYASYAILLDQAIGHQVFYSNLVQWACICIESIQMSAPVS